ncbi:MAG: HyaD/HybD family hydrogenase maturation endopeptidase [Gemmatimonadales bacterium]
MSTPRTRVIGLGSPIMGDDGFGLAVLARLEARWHLPEDVELVDGGTWGMSLLPTIEDSDHVLFVDAINTGSAPGTIAVIEREQLPKYFMLKLSPHQIDIREVLAACELRGTLPDVTEAYGAQPEIIDMSTELSPALAARVDEVADLVGARLGRLGHACRRID